MSGRPCAVAVAALAALAAGGCGCEEGYPRGLLVVMQTASGGLLFEGPYRLDVDADGVRETFRFTQQIEMGFCDGDCGPRYIPYYRNVSMVMELVPDARLPTFNVYFDGESQGFGPRFVELRLFRDEGLLAEGVFLQDYATAHEATDICSDIRTADGLLILPDP
jgi:hypothetical protein